MPISKTKKQSIKTHGTISRLSRKTSNTNRNIIENSRNKYTLRIYSLNGFRVKVYDSYYKVIIRIGNEENECIRLSIVKNDLPEEQNNPICELEIFNYQPNCNMTEDMQQNKGTKLMMATIIQFIKDKYPFVKQIHLLDASTYKCDKIPIYKNTFSLYDYYLFKYGTTYYNHNYGAEMLYQSDKESHEINKSLIKQFKINKVLLEKYLSKLIGKIPVPSIEKDIKEFIEAIETDEFATVFIRRYKFNDNTCYLMYFFFEFIKKMINILTSSKILENDVIDKETYQTLLPNCFIAV
jgi:hypothetical protein